MRCVAIGECMVEVAPTGPGGGYATGFAGDTFNMAWYLARLRPDWQVDYLTAIGTDALSDRFLAFAERSGIGTKGVQRLPDRTLGLYLIHVEKGERSFSYWRKDSAARGLGDDPAHLDTCLSGADLVLFSGITLAILSEAARARLLSALEGARTRGARVAFDPNLRPSLWPNAAVMREGIMSGAAVADIVLPSLDEEMAQLGDLSVDETCRRYADAGADTVIVKNGSAAVRFWNGTGDGSVDLPSIVAPRDTTAAGDSFNAACLASIAAGAPLRDAILAGARLAAEVVQGHGALVPTHGA